MGRPKLTSQRLTLVVVTGAIGLPGKEDIVEFIHVATRQARPASLVRKELQQNHGFRLELASLAVRQRPRQWQAARAVPVLFINGSYTSRQGRVGHLDVTVISC